MQKIWLNMEFDPYEYTLTVRRVYLKGVQYCGTVQELPDVMLLSDSYQKTVKRLVEIIEDLHQAALHDKRPFPHPLLHPMKV